MVYLLPQGSIFFEMKLLHEKEIHKFGIKVCGIPAKKWTKVDEGENKGGWKWFQTFKARKGNALVYAGLGVGPRGSYLLFLKTTPEDFKENKAAYLEWYRSIRLF